MVVLVRSMEMGSELESVRRAAAFRGGMDSAPNWKRTSTITFRIDMKVCLSTELKKPEILSLLSLLGLFFSLICWLVMSENLMMWNISAVCITCWPRSSFLYGGS